LVHGSDRQAELIRLALAESPLGPSERESWQRLQARLRRPPSRLPLPALAAALAIAAAFAAWLARPHAELPLSPELFGSPASASRAAAAPSTIAQHRTAAPAEPTKSPLRASAGADSASSGSAAELDAAPCVKLAKLADYEAATACYGRVARGGSMTSELALYEKARLEARALGNAPLALRTLEEHQRRFPGGVLKSEVAFTRIDLFMQLGKRTEALAAIDQSLHGTLGRERAADLQLMRAGLLASGGDCAAALNAVSAARQAGAHPSRLEAVERRCSETTPSGSAPKAP
jgi:hypothetical protein